MQLGKSLIGAIVGAAIGIGLMVFFQLVLYMDGYWLAIPVALLTGLGVRLAASTKGHPSYVRGAITTIAAILAFMGGQYVVAQVASRGASADSVVANKSNDLNTPESDTNEAVTPADAPPPQQNQPIDRGPSLRRPGPPKSPVWDYVWLAIAALVGYELGRGTAAAATPAVGTIGSPDDGGPALGE